VAARIALALVGAFSYLAVVEPLARPDRSTEAILDFDIQLHGIEHTVNHVFELNSVDVK
jgi:hypothetical protein